MRSKGGKEEGIDGRWKAVREGGRNFYQEEGSERRRMAVREGGRK